MIINICIHKTMQINLHHCTQSCTVGPKPQACLTSSQKVWPQVSCGDYDLKYIGIFVCADEDDEPRCVTLTPRHKAAIRFIRKVCTFIVVRLLFTLPYSHYKQNK